MICAFLSANCADAADCELQFPQWTQPTSSAVTVVCLGQAEAQVWFAIFLVNSWPSNEQLRKRMYGVVANRAVRTTTAKVVNYS